MFIKPTEWKLQKVCWNVYIWNYIKTHLYILVAKLYYPNILFSIIYFAEHLYYVLYKNFISSLWTSFVNYISYFYLLCREAVFYCLNWKDIDLRSQYSCQLSDEHTSKQEKLTSTHVVPEHSTQNIKTADVTQCKVTFPDFFACGWHAGSTLGVKLNSLHVAFSRRLQAVTWRRHGFCLVAFEFWAIFYIMIPEWKRTIVEANNNRIWNAQCRFILPCYPAVMPAVQKCQVILPQQKHGWSAKHTTGHIWLSVWCLLAEEP